MPTEPPLSEQAQAVQAASEQTTTAGLSEIQEALSNITAARIGGASNAEVQRLEDDLKKLTAEPTPPVAPKKEQETAEQAEEAEPEAAEETATPAESEEAEPVAEAEETPAGEEPPAEPAAATEKEPDRFRFKDPKDRLIAQTAKTLGISLADAAARIAGKPAEQPPAEPAEPEAAPVPPAVAEIQTEIDTVEAALDDIKARRRAYGGDERLYGKEIADLDNEQADALRQLSKASGRLAAAELNSQQAAVSQQSIEVARRVNLAEAAKAYPALADKTSVLWKLSAQLAREAHDPANDNHAMASSVEAPKFFAAEAAKMLKVKPVAGKPAPVPSSVPPVTTPASPRPPGPAAGSKATSPPPPPKSAQQQAQDLESQTLAMIGGGKGGQGSGRPAVVIL